jgi:hypothetical protein
MVMVMYSLLLSGVVLGRNDDGEGVIRLIQA